MNLKIKRIAKQKEYTIGKLYINGKYFCDTLEDTDRGLTSEMNIMKIKTIKVFGKTAIPTGVYDVQLTYSPKFKKILPILQNVKGFSGIRIHQGNFPKDTEGCILVGYNSYKGMVGKSEITLNKLMKILQQNRDKITISIE